MHNTGKEQVQNSPGETNPKRKEDHHRLRSQHSGRAFEGDLQQSELVWCVDLSGCVDRASGFLPELSGAGFKNDIWSGFAKNKPENGNKSGVVNNLDIEDPKERRKLVKSYTG